MLTPTRGAVEMALAMLSAASVVKLRVDRDFGAVVAVGAAVDDSVISAFLSGI
ncbi:hypothetical protein GCM10023217_33200 [Gordonia alkaliphila]|uniref:Uncharacterized protein n=1 Tax=Gordonia alkaliphila TaxID=1053547 RepID=A0ABP8ZKK7_9ACTN